MPCQPETALQNQIRLAVSRECPGVTLFRNHCGQLQDSRGRAVIFGLMPGSGDLVGWKTIGGRAVFVSIEVKLPGEKLRPDQRHWMESVLVAGGIAGVAHSVDEAIDILR